MQEKKEIKAMSNKQEQFIFDLLVQKDMTNTSISQLLKSRDCNSLVASKIIELLYCLPTVKK